MFRLLFIICCWLAWSCPAEAHPALYHYVEINLHQAGEVRVFVTVHAPELSDDVAPLEEDVFGAEWLSKRSDEQIESLLVAARRFTKENFIITLGGELWEPTLVFAGAREIRSPDEASDIPAGCFSGEAKQNYTAGKAILIVQFSKLADKRLMLVINRPKSFPEVFDIEPGEQREIALPAIPVKAEK